MKQQSPVYVPQSSVGQGLIYKYKRRYRDKTKNIKIKHMFYLLPSPYPQYRENFLKKLCIESQQFLNSLSNNQTLQGSSRSPLQNKARVLYFKQRNCSNKRVTALRVHLPVLPEGLENALMENIFQGPKTSALNKSIKYIKLLNASCNLLPELMKNLSKLHKKVYSKH